MQNYLYDQMDYNERLSLLRKMSIGRETMTFKRSLTPEDLVDRKDLFARDNMRLATMKEDFKELKALKTADIKAMEKGLEESLEVIANGNVEVFDETFLMPNYEKGLILFVDKNGEIVHQREMKPEERQGRLMLDGPGPEEKKDNVTDVDFEEIEIESTEATQAAATDDVKGTDPGDQIPPVKNKRAPRKKKQPAGKVEDVVKDIVEETNAGNSDNTQADPEAMERVKEWDHENN